MLGIYCASEKSACRWVLFRVLCGGTLMWDDIKGVLWRSFVRGGDGEMLDTRLLIIRVVSSTWLTLGIPLRVVGPLAATNTSHCSI